MNNSLQGLTILDFSHRLPGPLACEFLAQMGAKVYKIEDETFKDAFIEGPFAKADKSFKSWYKELNKSKEIVRLNFKLKKTSDLLHDYADKADIVLMALPKKWRDHHQLNFEDFAKNKKPLVYAEMSASEKKMPSMHDLNALAESGLLELHLADRNEDIIDPPFLPIAGINFARQICTDILAAYIQASRTQSTIRVKSYLYESTLNAFSPFWPMDIRSKQTKFLHNGAFPCYSIYKTKDRKYLVVASVEEKFWQQFTELFAINLPLNERFRTDKEAFSIVSKVIKNLSSTEISKQISGKDLCLNLIG